MVDDARYRLKVWLDLYLNVVAYPAMGHIYEDNGTTEALNAVMYSLPNVPLKLLFFGTLTYDAVFTIGEPVATVTQGHNLAAYKYQEEIPVTIYAVDKTGLTAVKMLWQAELKLRKIAETYANGTGTLRVLRRTKPGAQYLSGFFLYSVECVLSYMRPAAIAQTTAKISFYNGFLDDFDNGVYGTTVYTAEAGSSDTIIHDDTLTENADFWNGRTVKMLTGTYAGVEKKITDFTTPELTVEAFAGNIDAGDTFIISNWQETEDGNTATIDTYVDDWLGITVSASANPFLCYYSYPSEATNHTTHLTLPNDTYTKIRWRFICSNANVKARIDLVFSDGDVQPVLAATNNVSWTVGSATLTAAHTLDHIRVYATAATGTVYYDFIQVYKGDFTFPNIVSIEDSFQRRDAITGIPGMGGDSTQGLGTQSAEFDLTVDLTVSNDNDDWKRPQGTLTPKASGEYKAGQVFWDIVHRAYNDPWVWIDTEEEQFKAAVSIQREERRGDTHTLTLHVTEIRESSANSEYVYQRLGMDQ